MFAAVLKNNLGAIPVSNSRCELGRPISKSPPKAKIIPDDGIGAITKDQYVAIVKKRRREFVHTHFADVLTAMYLSLRDDADKMKACRREVVFENIPPEFEMDKLENVLSAYFVDMGYKPIEARRDPGQSKIVIILT